MVGGEVVEQIAARPLFRKEGENAEVLVVPRMPTVVKISVDSFMILSDFPDGGV